MSSERIQPRISFEEIILNAKEVTLRDGHHMPILIVEGSTRLIVSPIPEMPTTHQERVELMSMFGEATARIGRVGQLKQVFLISEGWMSVASEGRIPELRPADDPQRKEVLIISGLQLPEQRRHLRLFEMLRNPNSQVVSLPELVPPGQKDERVEIPLLDAFANGFQVVCQGMVN